MCTGEQKTVTLTENEKAKVNHEVCLRKGRRSSGRSLRAFPLLHPCSPPSTGGPGHGGDSPLQVPTSCREYLSKFHLQYSYLGPPSDHQGNDTINCNVKSTALRPSPAGLVATPPRGRISSKVVILGPDRGNVTE